MYSECQKWLVLLFVSCHTIVNCFTLWEYKIHPQFLKFALVSSAQHKLYFQETVIFFKYSNPWLELVTNRFSLGIISATWVTSQERGASQDTAKSVYISIYLLYPWRIWSWGCEMRQWELSGLELNPSDGCQRQFQVLPPPSLLSVWRIFWIAQTAEKKTETLSAALWGSLGSPRAPGDTGPGDDSS